MPWQELRDPRGRDCISGTWDLFRYPGIRSDSDMYTLGYSFKPWTEAKAIADGPHILNYVRETAAENGIDRNIRFNHRVKRASWSSQDARWTVEAQRKTDEGGSETVRFTCNFLFMCSGYYKYEEGYTPEFSGTADFTGKIVHPQKWPEDLDYAGKRVVVIGSGATAVTLVPEMAKKAAHVTMLQRSPTYVVARPAEDALANATSLANMSAVSSTAWTGTATGSACRTISIQRYRNCRRWISPPAMCSARSRNCRSRAPSGRGGSTRITRSTSSRCATARSMMA
jgi:cation diffusion facilitator CzcD-associated flavoprotein CzcO